MDEVNTMEPKENDTKPVLGRTTPAITTAKFEQSSIFGLGKTLRPNSIRELIEMAINAGVLTDLTIR